MTPTNATKLRRVRWAAWRFLRRNRLRLAVGAVFAALAANVAVQDGAPVLIVLLIAGLGCAAAWALPLYTAGYSAARHSLRERDAIESGTKREELDR